MQDIWRQARIEIDGASPEEEAAVSFAQYHLLGMMPWHSTDCSIAAKGLTGEGYKGHVFWDAEIFILPFFQYVFPQAARNLLEFRYKGRGIWLQGRHVSLGGSRNRAGRDTALRSA